MAPENESFFVLFFGYNVAACDSSLLDLKMLYNFIFSISF